MTENGVQNLRASIFSPLFFVKPQMLLFLSLALKIPGIFCETEKKVFVRATIR